MIESLAMLFRPWMQCEPMACISIQRVELRTTTAHLVTSDPEIAKKYDMHEESEFWDEPKDQDAGEAETK